MSQEGLETRWTLKGIVGLGQMMDSATSRTPFQVLVLALWAVFGLPGVQAQDCVEQGKEYLKEERIADALASLDRCKQTNQENAGAYFFTGLALAAEGNMIEALSELEKAVELNPDNVEFVRNRKFGVCG